MSQLRQLSAAEIEDVSGGVAPLVIAAGIIGLHAISIYVSYRMGHFTPRQPDTKLK
jgi:lactobin A/cerein 7B family class IIb bacteriocin